MIHGKIEVFAGVCERAQQQNEDSEEGMATLLHNNIGTKTLGFQILD